ncbi:HMG box, partial [Oesophagostomum dentatum]
PVIVVSRNGSDEKPPKSERSRSPVRFAPRFPRDRCKLPTRTKMSPFVFFVMKCYEEYKKKHSNTAVPIKEISRKCSQKWKRMSDEERRYYELAQEEGECSQVE